MRHAVLTVMMLVVTLGMVFVTVMAVTQDPRPEPEKSDPEPVQQVVQQAPAEPAPKPVVVAPPPPPVQIERVPVNGQDLVDLTSMSMWKYAFHLPASQYTAYVWIEYWTRTAEAPKRRELFTASGSWSNGEVVVKLPTERDTSMLVRIGDSAARARSADPVRIPDGSRVDLLRKQPLELAKDIPLATFTYNETDSAKGGLTNVHRDHDVTVYLKARFVEGPWVPFNEGSEPSIDDTAF